MGTLKASAWLGIAAASVGLLLLVLRLGDRGEWWPFMVYQLVGAALLFAGALSVWRGADPRWLTAGWGYGVAMNYGPLFIHIETLLGASDGAARRETKACLALAAMLFVDVVGLALSLWPSRSRGAA